MFPGLLWRQGLVEWVPFFLLRRLCSSIKRDPSPPPPPLIFPFFVFFFHQECQWHQLASQPPTQPCCFPSFYSVDKRANVRRLRTVKTFVNQLFIFPSTAYSSKGVGCPHGNLCLIPLSGSSHHLVARRRRRRHLPQQQPLRFRWHRSH